MIYEGAVSWKEDQRKAYEQLAFFKKKNQAKSINRVLFDDAMQHLIRSNRTIQLKRGSSMLVGMGAAAASL